MKSFSKTIATLAVAMGALSCSYSAHADDLASLEARVSQLEQKVNLLSMEQVVYGPITVSHIHLGNDKHFTTVQPGQTIECKFEYQLDSSQQDFLSKYYLLVGIDGVACETCVTHLRGIWDSKGTGNFNLTAPLAEGDYEVRIAYRPADSCEEAINSWNVLGIEPSSCATIGIIKVRN